MLEKFKVFFGAGITSCWLVSPVTMSVNVYSVPAQVQIFHTGDIIDAVLGIQLPFADIFA
ncbi:MAG: hypothetical protein GY801_23655 [bacterium]|nr:hypothetical protein [bacterium]